MRLNISLQQKLTISPVIMQTLELLTIPTIDLAERLEEEAEINPVLELEYKKNKDDNSMTPDEEIETKFQDSSDTGYESRKKDLISNKDFNSQTYIENFSATEVNIFDNLMEQLAFASLDERQMNIARLILTTIDGRGFLPLSSQELTEETDYQVTEIEKMRRLIMNMDPIGIGSYDLQEFLLVQIEHEWGPNSVEYKIIRDHLELLEKKHYSKIAKKLGISFSKIEIAVQNIKKLNINPSFNINNEPVKYIVPDARLEVENGEINLVLNDEYIPDIKLNQYYISLYSESDDKSTKNFLKENIDKAKILVENLKSRKEIIFKVILSIISHQKKYFTNEEQQLLPLKLKDIADELNIHESTVSRAIREKYIQTDKGIISLKSFFSTHVGSDDVSSNGIKDNLKRIIEAEDKNDPLSDDKIVRIFKNKGVSLSRRTVAKYRSQLNIPAAYIRRNPL